MVILSGNVFGEQGNYKKILKLKDKIVKGRWVSILANSSYAFLIQKEAVESLAAEIEKVQSH